MLESSEASVNQTPSETPHRPTTERAPESRREMIGLTGSQIEQLREVLTQTDPQTRRRPARAFFSSSCQRTHYKRLVLLLLVLIVSVMVSGGEFHYPFARLVSRYSILFDGSRSLIHNSIYTNLIIFNHQCCCGSHLPPLWRIRKSRRSRTIRRMLRRRNTPGPQGPQSESTEEGRG